MGLFFLCALFQNDCRAEQNADRKPCPERDQGDDKNWHIHS